ncbi:MAG: division/cell wall cluster transcriptional repressor MraZ [Ignavibacteriaceae bacterium]|nr:division/cell wall cluster transcriptional repressor MraZ [Ignavibacteriaceae bacterium]
MFRGYFLHTVDAKGRFSIPAKMRKHVSAEANNNFVLVKGTVNCIDLYPLDLWSEFEAKMLQLNQFEPEKARFIRTISQDLAEDTWDSQSRILIPQKLLKHAQIEKEIVILGALTKIELWNPQVFEEYINQSPETYEQIAAKVMAG